MKSSAEEYLIKGVFTPEQALTVITTLFRSKIQMHSLSSFSSLVQEGKESAEDNSRRNELMESLDRLVDAIKSVNSPNNMIKLDCRVNMTIVSSSD